MNIYTVLFFIIAPVALLLFTAWHIRPLLHWHTAFTRLFVLIRGIARLVRHRCASLALLLWLFALAPLARAQVTPSNTIDLTNMPATMVTATASNQTSQIVLRQNTGLAFEWVFNSSAGNGMACYIDVFPSVDGVNIASTNAWRIQGLSTGITNVVATTNWSAATLAGYTALFFQTTSNGTTGTLTNKFLRGSYWNPPRS